MTRHVTQAPTNFVITEQEDDALSVSTIHRVTNALPVGARYPESDEDFAEMDAVPIPDTPTWEQLTPGLPHDLGFVGGWPFGSIVVNGGVTYYQEGTLAQLPTGNFFTPGGVGTLWRPIAGEAGGLDPWGPVPYALDAEVEYTPDETEWRNNRPNNNQAFAPPVGGSGWYQIGPGAGPFPWKHVGNEGYVTPWQVTHNGRLWSNPSANNFWEPGVALWVDDGPAP